MEQSYPWVPDSVAEQARKDGMPLWSCPGCTMEWRGDVNSEQWHAYRSHTTRHAHARIRHGPYDPTKSVPDERRRHAWV